MLVCGPYTSFTKRRLLTDLTAARVSDIFHAWGLPSSVRERAGDERPEFSAQNAKTTRLI